MKENILEEIKNAKKEDKHITAHEKTKRKPGRKPKAIKFDRRVVTYFREDQFEIITEYCDLLGISANEFIRNTVMEKLNKRDTEKEIDTFIDKLNAIELGESIKDFLKSETR